MSTQKSNQNLIWIDLEMTGLDPDKERIIEIATIITDSNLTIVAEGPNLVINQPKELIENMDEWNTKQHGNSGLTKVSPPEQHLRASRRNRNLRIYFKICWKQGLSNVWEYCFS